MKFLTPFSLSPTNAKKNIGCQIWDEKVTFKMRGKTIVIKDYVQENAEGTDFYENLKKFGNLEDTIEFMNKNRAEIVENFEETLTLQNLEDRRIKLQEIWNKLPAEIRAQFDNNFSMFMTNGSKFFDEQAKILQEQIKENEIHQKETANNNSSQKKENAETKKPTSKTE